MEYKLIVNPAAGRGNVGKLLPRLKALLAQKRISYDLAITKSPGHAIELAREAAKDFQTVVAVGGDGK